MGFFFFKHIFQNPPEYKTWTLTLRFIGSKRMLNDLDNKLRAHKIVEKLESEIDEESA